MTVKELLHAWVDQLSDEEAAQMLAQIEDEEDDDVLSPAEIERVLEGEAQIARGETVDGDALLRELGH